MKMNKKVWVGLIIAVVIIIVGALSYFFMPIAANADAFTQDNCSGLTGPGFRDCTQNSLTWENYMMNHNNAQFKKYLKRMVKKNISGDSTAIDTYDLSVTKNGTGAGTIVSSGPNGLSCGSNCTATYDSGTVVTLTETPVAGSTFTGWGGVCSGTATTCAVTVKDNESVTAAFTAPTPVTSYNLSVAEINNGSGTITSNPSGISCNNGAGSCSTTVVSGTEVTLTENPASGSTFAGWGGGACSGSSSTCSVTVTSNTNITAAFNTTAPVIPTSFNLQVTTTGSGTVTDQTTPGQISCGSNCKGTYDTGSVVTLQATANTGSTFAGWGGACSGTGTCAVTMNSDENVTATFTAPTPVTFYNLNLTENGTGTGTITSVPVGINCNGSGAGCSATYNSGISVVLTAVPDAGTSKPTWTGCTPSPVDLSLTPEPSTCTVSMNANEAVTATFNSTTPAVLVTGCPGVTVYANTNYTGTSACLAVGNYLRTNLTSEGIANDSISSLKVEPGYAVTVSRDDNFTGGSQIFVQNIPILANMGRMPNSTYTWENNISSLKVTKLASTPVVPDSTLATGCAGMTAYTAVNYGGTSTCLTVGNYLMNDLIANGSPDNSIVSFKLEPGYTTTVSRDDNYTGGSQLFTQSISDLNALGNMPSSNYTWKNNISSLKVTKLASTPTPTPTPAPASTSATVITALGANNTPLTNATVSGSVYVPCTYSYYYSSAKTVDVYFPVSISGTTDQNGKFSIKDNDIITAAKTACLSKVDVMDDHHTASTNGTVVNGSDWYATVSIKTDSSAASVDHDVTTNSATSFNLAAISLSQAWAGAIKYDNAIGIGTKNLNYTFKYQAGSSLNFGVNTVAPVTGCLGATVYTNANYSGTSACVMGGIYNASFGSVGNDAVSSIKVEPGYSVNIYRDSNLGGGLLSVTANIPDLSKIPDVSWDNAASSIKVVANPPITPTTTATPEPASGVTASNIGQSGFILRWQDMSTNETGFKVSIGNLTAPAATDCSNATYYPSVSTLNYTAVAGAGMQIVTGLNASSSSMCAKVIATNTKGDSAPAYSAPITLVAPTPVYSGADTTYGGF